MVVDLVFIAFWLTQINLNTLDDCRRHRLLDILLYKLLPVVRVIHKTEFHQHTRHVNVAKNRKPDAINLRVAPNANSRDTTGAGELAFDTVGEGRGDWVGAVIKGDRSARRGVSPVRIDVDAQEQIGVIPVGDCRPSRC